IRAAHAAVSEATALLASRPAGLEALRVRYNVTVPPGTHLARRLLAGGAARVGGGSVSEDVPEVPGRRETWCARCARLVTPREACSDARVGARRTRPCSAAGSAA